MATAFFKGITMQANSNSNPVANAITAIVVTESRRLDFLPSYFGLRLMIKGESAIYSTLENLTTNYRGGFWDYYSLSNGGFYMAPRSEEPIHFNVEGNGFSGTLSADAAGIVACLFTLNSMAFSLQNAPEYKSLAQHYWHLREFAESHSEASLILAAID
jgi:hypothetical protein